MIELSLITAFVVQAVWYTLQDGEIFGTLGNWLRRTLPAWALNPVVDCPICMTPWYGFLFLLIYGFRHGKLVVSLGDVSTFPFILIIAMGINVTITKLWPHDGE